jgi:hypothetical protein
MASTYEFGPFYLDEAERTLQGSGVGVTVTPKAFDVLLLLVSNANRLVEKSKLLGTVWGDVHVDEAVLTRAISDLRKALGQTSDPAAARTALNELEAGARAGRVPEYAVMFAHARQSHINQALDWMERMLDTHGVWLITAKVNPMFDALRSQPRGRAVLARLNLN